MDDVQTIDPYEQEAADDRVRAAFVIHLAALAFRLPPDLIRAAKRSHPAAIRARRAALYLMHLGFRLTPARVGAAFRCDPSTVSKALNDIEDLRDDRQFDDLMTRLEECIGRAPSDPGILPGARP